MLSFIEEIAKLIHVWMETRFMRIRNHGTKMFLNVSLRTWKNATAVVEYLTEFKDVCDNMWEYVIVLDPLFKSMAEYLLHVGYE